MACLVPRNIRNSKSGDMVTVPCSSCVECRKRYVSAWSYRLMQENKNSKTSYFITLTYDTVHVPITPKGFMGLRPNDLMLFCKRLRKRHTNGMSSIKYYAVGEYGDESFRPHYHLIMFNIDLSKLIGERNASMIRAGKIPLDGKYEFKTSVWENGHLTIGEVTGASVGYCLIYMSKPPRVPVHRNDDRIPEFSRMSKGIGESYLSPAMLKWHKDDLENRMYVNLEDGKVASMPRYYKDKIYNDFERLVASENAKEKMFKQKDKDYKKYGPDYYRKRSEGHFAAIDKQKAEKAKKKTL